MEKTPSASETVATHEKAKPLLLERETDVCEKPHSALWFSKKEELKKMFSLLKSIISAILTLLLVTGWDI